MPLDETIDAGDIGHIADHEAIHAVINDLPAVIGDLATDAEVAAAVAAHEAAGNPHPTYETSAEVDTKIATHAGLSDPHTGYRLESADHTHASTGAQAGQLDHGTALTGLSDDDHPQYRLESADHSHASAGAEGGKIDHGAALNGLSDDDHPQYAIKFPITFSKAGVLEASTDTGAHRFYLEGNHTITDVQISAGVAPTGAAIIVDVHVSGTTIFTTQSNRPEIAISGFFDASGTIEDADHDDGQYLTVNIDQVGSTIAGENLTVIVWIKRR